MKIKACWCSDSISVWHPVIVFHCFSLFTWSLASGFLRYFWSLRTFEIKDITVSWPSVRMISFHSIERRVLTIDCCGFTLDYYIYASIAIIILKNLSSSLRRSIALSYSRPLLYASMTISSVGFFAPRIIHKLWPDAWKNPSISCNEKFPTFFSTKLCSVSKSIQIRPHNYLPSTHLSPLIH